VVFVAVAATALATAGGALSATTTTGQTGAGDSGTFSVKDFKDSFWMIALLVGIVALTWVIPLLVDLFKAYRFHRRRMDMFEELLRDESRQPPLTTQELLASNFVPASPSGLIGLSRGLVALTIATSIAIA